MEVLLKLEELKNLKGSILKKEYLEENKDNFVFNEIVKFLLDTRLLTGISTKKYNKMKKFNQSYKSILEVIDYLKINNTGKDKDIVYVVDNSPSDEKLNKIYKDVICKKYKIGLTAKSYNEVFPNSIKVFSVMKGISYKDGIIPNGMNIIITDKLDGYRCEVEKSHKDGIKIYSPEGNLKHGLIEIENELESIGFTDFVLSSEALVRDPNNELTRSERYAKTGKILDTDGADKSQIDLHIFDIVPLDKFEEGRDNTPCYKRKDNIRRIIENGDFKHLKYVYPSYEGVFDKEIIDKIYGEKVDNGAEGIMINLSEAPHLTKKCRFLFKKKDKGTADVRIIGFYEGTNKLEGMLGGVNIEFEHEGKVFQTKCGGGFSESLRKDIWDNQDKYLNNIIEISHYGISSNEKDGKGFRHSNFEYFRNDKELSTDLKEEI